MAVPISTVVDVTVELSNPSVTSADFSVGLIIGNSTYLTATNRVKIYDSETWQTQMTGDGFTSTSPEYLAVAAYFSQNPAANRVAVGVKLTSDTADVDALNACRSFSAEWYGVCFCYDLQEDSISAIAAAVEAFDIPTVFFYQTDDTGVYTSSDGGIFKTLQDANYSRSVGFYSTQDYFIAGVLGLFSGLNSQDAGSAYTMAFKTVVGFVAEDVNQTQLNTIVSFDGNVYANFSNRYSFIYPGISASGYHIDELFFVDLTEDLIQSNVIAGLVDRRKIPQTESGVNDIITFITTACNRLLSIGFIGSGIWNGGQVLNLSNGDAVSNGYIIQAESIDGQSTVDRQNRISPTIYVCLKATGAIEHVVIRAYINR